MNKEFEVLLLNHEGIVKASNLAREFDGLLTRVLNIVSAPQTPSPNGREIALVRTHMELASFYAKKAMAKLPENNIEESL